MIDGDGNSQTRKPPYAIATTAARSSSFAAFSRIRTSSSDGTASLRAGFLAGRAFVPRNGLYSSPER